MGLRVSVVLRPGSRPRPTRTSGEIEPGSCWEANPGLACCDRDMGLRVGEDEEEEEGRWG